MKYIMQVEIEAEQFLPEENKIPKGVMPDGPRSPKNDTRAAWILKSPDGTSYIKSGDYVVTQGENHYIMRKDLFEKNYKPLEEEPTGA